MHEMTSRYIIHFHFLIHVFTALQHPHTVSQKMGDSTETENTLLRYNDKRRSWTTRDCLVLTLNILVKLGDSVEIYLPGVITQDVSCQMGLSSLQEGFLAVILYVTMGATILVTAFLTDRYKQIVFYLIF